MTELDVPFVYTVDGRIPPSRTYRRRFAVDQRRIDVPSLSVLPPPTYTVVLEDSSRLSWYEINGVLMRPVLFGDGIATIEEIEAETALVSPRKRDWFHDHPAAYYLSPKKRRDPFVETISARLQERANDRADRWEAARRVYEHCHKYRGMILRPAAPPTIGVLVTADSAALEISIDRWSSTLTGMYHFDIAHLAAAKGWAVQQRGPDNVYVPPELVYDPEEQGLKFPKHPRGPHSGAVATARSFAREYLLHHSRKRLDALGQGRVKAIMGMRHVYENDAVDEEAGALLTFIHETTWPGLPKSMLPQIKLLRSWQQATRSGDSQIEPMPTPEDMMVLATFGAEQL